MQEKDLKPSVKQRIIFIVVAAVLLGSSFAAYVMIVMGKGTINYSKMTTEQLEKAYNEKMTEVETEAATLSTQYFEEFKSYKSKVKAYNTSTANSNGVQSKDLKEGDGEEISDSGYSAYYIGWCADESVFDSSFDNFDEPTTLKTPLTVTASSLIEGWYLGTEGMKIGGVREITIPGALAWGESMEICGGTNSPVKFSIMAIETNENLKKLNDELDKIETALYSDYTQTYSEYDTDSHVDDSTIEEEPKEE